MGELALVTVIIPVYNRERFLRATVDSVLAQTYPAVELIAVDDGSTDGSRGILEEYGDRLRLLAHPDGGNKGQSAAINLGLESARGEYVAILDSDDLFAPEKLARQVAYLEANPDVGVVFANGCVMDADGVPRYPIFPEGHVITDDPAELLLDCSINVPSNALIRKSVLDRVGGFDETMRSAQDHDMLVRLAEQTRFGYVDEVLWYYRRHGQSQSGQFARRRWETGFRILDKACRRYPYGRTVRRRRLAVLHFRLGQCAVEERRYGEAAWRFLLAGLLDPRRAAAVVLRRERGSRPHP